MPQPPYAIIPTTSHRRPRYGLLVLGALVLAGAGIGAALMLRPAGVLPTTVVAEALVPAAVTSAPTAPPEAAQKPAAATTPLLTRSASVCLTCGTVEAVLASDLQAGGKPGGAYQVQVRMDDGTLRSFTSATQPQPGAAVRVEGSSFRLARAGG